MLAGKVIAVIGSGPGLGAEVVRLALRDGAMVAFGARTADRLAGLQSSLDPGGARTLAGTIDVGDQASVDHFFGGVHERFGRVDGVAVVAAMVTTIGESLSIDDDVWRASFETNVLGVTRVARAARAGFGAAGGGSLVLVGTQASHIPMGGMGAYGATKGAAQVPLMHYLARELGSARIRVNTVETSWMLGPLVQGYMDMMATQQGTTAQAIISGIAAGWPIPEMPLDEDVAEAIVFLLSNRARMITGQVLRVNAGEYLSS